MKVHEYQAKKLFSQYGIPVPVSQVCDSKEQAEQFASSIKSKVVVKAQIHAGGRGKGGGVKLATTPEQAAEYAEQILGMNLVTHQTGAEGKKVLKVLVEKASDITAEYYVGMVLDRAAQKVALIASSQGGMEIEQVAKTNPEAIVSRHIPITGFQPYIARSVAYEIGFTGDQVKQFTKIAGKLYSIFIEKDVSLIEINPLALTDGKTLMALDAKINFDDNALFRHPDIVALRDLTEEDPLEIKASEYDLNYIQLGGNVGCMVNGAGLAMATMDIIKLYGAEPANFLDVGGAASEERVEAAFNILVSEKKVKSILVNIFGGIVRCDIVAQGIVNAARNINLKIPLIVRLQGTNHELGKKIIAESGMKIIPAETMEDAARLAVKNAA